MFGRVVTAGIYEREHGSDQLCGTVCVAYRLSDCLIGSNMFRYLWIQNGFISVEFEMLSKSKTPQTKYQLNLPRSKIDRNKATISRRTVAIESLVPWDHSATDIKH